MRTSWRFGPLTVKRIGSSTDDILIVVAELVSVSMCLQCCLA
jgi:hypothetical protein